MPSMSPLPNVSFNVPHLWNGTGHICLEIYSQLQLNVLSVNLSNLHVPKGYRCNAHHFCIWLEKVWHQFF